MYPDVNDVVNHSDVGQLALSKLHGMILDAVIVVVEIVEESKNLSMVGSYFDESELLRFEEIFSMLKFLMSHLIIVKLKLVGPHSSP